MIYLALVLMFLFGGVLGLLIACACFISRRADEQFTEIASTRPPRLPR